MLVFGFHPVLADVNPVDLHKLECILTLPRAVDGGLCQNKVPLLQQCFSHLQAVEHEQEHVMIRKVRGKPRTEIVKERNLIHL